MRKKRQHRLLELSRETLRALDKPRPAAGGGGCTYEATGCLTWEREDCTNPWTTYIGCEETGG